jgi:hypothetical protein
MFPAQMLPSELQRVIFEASFRFHGRKDRKAALRAFRTIWASLRPHVEALTRLEKEVLIPDGIYRLSDSRYQLHEKTLNALVDDRERYEAFAKRAGAIFLNAEGLVPVRTCQPQAAHAIA